MKKTVWKFTNQRELTKSEFLDYFERKIFRTIRKHQMLPKTKKISIKKSNDLNTIILKKVLEKKFEVAYSTKPNFSSKNLSEIAEESFDQVLKGNFKIKTPKNAPLSALLDEEIELYAKLTNTKGTKRKRNEKIQKLFSKFKTKNQDLEVNVLKATEQLS